MIRLARVAERAPRTASTARSEGVDVALDARARFERAIARGATRAVNVERCAVAARWRIRGTHRDANGRRRARVRRRGDARCAAPSARTPSARCSSCARVATRARSRAASSNARARARPTDSFTPRGAFATRRCETGARCARRARGVSRVRAAMDAGRGGRGEGGEESDDGVLRDAGEARGGGRGRRDEDGDAGGVRTRGAGEDGIVEAGNRTRRRWGWRCSRRS